MQGKICLIAVILLVQFNEILSIPLKNNTENTVTKIVEIHVQGNYTEDPIVKYLKCNISEYQVGCVFFYIWILVLFAWLIFLLAFGWWASTATLFTFYYDIKKDARYKY